MSASPRKRDFSSLGIPFVDFRLLNFGLASVKVRKNNVFQLQTWRRFQWLALSQANIALDNKKRGSTYLESNLR
jgi:hypothetical protein